MSEFNLTAILQILTTLVIAIIGFFMKRELKKLEESDVENKNNIQALEKETRRNFEKVKEDYLERINSLKDEISKDFVRRSDYFQTTGELIKKVDKIYDMLYELKGSGK